MFQNWRMQVCYCGPSACVIVLSYVFPRAAAVAHKKAPIVNMYNNLYLIVCFTKSHCEAFGCSLTSLSVLDYCKKEASYCVHIMSYIRILQ